MFEGSDFEVNELSEWCLLNFNRFRDVLGRWAARNSIQGPMNSRSRTIAKKGNFVDDFGE